MILTHFIPFNLRTLLVIRQHQTFTEQTGLSVPHVDSLNPQTLSSARRPRFPRPMPALDMTGLDLMLEVEYLPPQGENISCAVCVYMHICCSKGCEINPHGIKKRIFFFSPSFLVVFMLCIFLLVNQFFF